MRNRSGGVKMQEAVVMSEGREDEENLYHTTSPEPTRVPRAIDFARPYVAT